MRIIHPIKLARGVYRIIGIPKFVKSRVESKSHSTVGSHITAIPNNVTVDVRIAAFASMERYAGDKSVETFKIIGIDKPTRNPKMIVKIGTPIPIPIDTSSRNKNRVIRNALLVIRVLI
jgi:hypothetical protein